jgi:hypothetical protein
MKLKSHFFLLPFLVTNTFAQSWKKQSNKNMADSVYAVYSWEVHDDVHGAYGEIILTKGRRFSYISASPLSNQEFSEGTYYLKKDTLILNSDLQYNNIMVKIEYIDSSKTDSNYKRINFPRNILGDTLTDGYYLINYDSSLSGMFFPDFPITTRDRILLDSMHHFKVKINRADFGSDWIPVQKNNKFINVIILTTKDYHDNNPKVFSNYKFLIKGDSIIEITRTL